MPPRPAPPPPPVDPAQDPSSPFYVHASENPAVALVHPLLTGKNYHSWARAMKRAIIVKNKHRFIDPHVEVPDSYHPSYEAWIRCNNLVHSWILNSVSPSIAQSIVFIENAVDVWIDLRDRFAQGDLVRIAELQQDLYSFKQNSLSVTDYFTELKIMWEELENYRPTHPCVCTVKCACDASYSVKEYRNQDYVMRFLMGLNENFAMVRSQILLMTPLPVVSKAFSMVLQQERQCVVPEDTQFSANAVDGRKQYGSYGRGKTNRVCTYCGKIGHTVDICYKKHGYPPNSNTGNTNKFHSSSVHAANATELDSESISQEDRESSQSYQEQALPKSQGIQNNFLNMFTAEDCQRLKALLSQNSAGTTSSSQPQINQASSASAHSVQGTLCASPFTKQIHLDSWIIDSGATDHVSNSLTWFSAYHTIDPISVRLPNGVSVIARHRGSVHIRESLVLLDVLYIPNFSFNLLSIPKLTKDLSCEVLLTQDKCLLQGLNKQMIGLGKLSQGLYYLDVRCPAQKPPQVALHLVNNITVLPKSALWHFRLGHASHKNLLLLSKHFPSITVNKESTCDICHFSKQKRLVFPVSSSRATRRLELLHMDIWGPFRVSTLHHQRYFLTVVDDFSRFTWIVLLKNKGQVQCQVEAFINFVETQFDTKVKTVRSDNGPEFALQSFYAKKGIFHQKSCVETPQQNARVERRHQTILNVARALLMQSSLPSTFWGYAVQYAVFLINRMPTQVLQDQSPYEVFHQHLPQLEDFKVFGCLCYIATSLTHRHKFTSRARKCVFLGYKAGMKGAIGYDLNTREIVISRHTVYEELVFPYKDHQALPNSVGWSYIDHTLPVISDDLSANTSSDIPSSSSDALPPSDEALPTECPMINPPSNADAVNESTVVLPVSPTSEQIIPLRRSTRAKTMPSHLLDYHLASSCSTPYPISSYVTYDRLSSTHKAYALSLLTTSEPKSYHEACQHPCWQSAMQAEIQALEANHTWKIVPLAKGIVPIGSKWVYKIKRHSDGSIERYKARLVAKGYNQTEGLDYFETFSPVTKLSTVRLVLALASIKHWHIQQLDVNNAFLHGELQEDVYMAIPQGVSGDPKTHVCKLTKSLYGLKQASRKWYEKLSSLLYTLDYKQASSDHSLFVKHSSGLTTLLLVYVDDIILVGDDASEIHSVKSTLHSTFGIKDLGQLKFFLGIEAAHSSTGITLCQRKYCLDLLTEAGVLGCKPAATPLDPNLKLHQDDSPLHSDVLQYRRLIGQLLYLTNTRPDITFVVQQLSQFLATPTTQHFQAAQRVLRYLKGNPGKGIFFPRSSSLQLMGFSDADWGGCKDTRKSTTGYCFFLGSSPVCWRAKKQSTIARSSAEAEYRALASSTCELQWLSYLLQDIGITDCKQAVLFCDNKSALHIAANPVFHERTKHLEIDCHVVRNKTQEGLMKLLPVTSQQQTADLFTKGLLPARFTELLSKMNMVNIFHPSSS